MQHSDFVHLHLHTEYSILDGAIRIDPLMKKAAEFGMPAIAMTDHGNMFGMVTFYQTAKKHGIKPIIGCEVYIAPGKRTDRFSTEGISDTSYHLVLLIKNQTGYKNLIKMVSAGYLEGFYYRPRIDKELLEKHNEGLIALSACMKGEVSRLILQGKEDKAIETATWYRDLMGEGRYYLEIQDEGIKEQKGLNDKLIEISKKLSIPLVATNDCHYLEQKDSVAHEALLCIQTGKTLKDEKRMRMSTDQFYVRSPDEMKALFKNTPEAISNTLEIANKCNLDLRFDQMFLPKYAVPSDMTLDSYLEERSRHGLANRLKKIETDENTRKAYFDRLRIELDIIFQMKYSGYFLIVWDFMDYARKNDIAVGPGRGSAAGSLVAYSLAITDVDPMRYNLLFERFLNPERVSMPDIDIDFCMERREEVIQYVTKKYVNVSQIITFGCMNAKGVIRDVGRVMDIPYGDVDKIAKLVPTRLNITLKDALNEEKRLQESIKNNPQIKELFDIALTLEGLVRHCSTHAAGIVIAPLPITEFLPLYKGSKGDVTTQFSMTEVEMLGLLKMDFLGLRTLTVIQKAVKQIRKQEPDFNIDTIRIDDELTYKLLQEGKTFGVFQLESSGLRDIIKKLKPAIFEDLIALVALYRPGPLGSGMVDDFINRKHGKVEIKNIIPELDDILKETYGVIVYQEQVMKTASTVGGFSLGGADILRRAMGKKKFEEMALQRKKFTEGAKNKGIDPKKAEKIFDLMEHFAGYGFNKSHSAAYALVAYQTAYLKAHYPSEFMASLLTSEMTNTDKIVIYISECRDMSIQVLPPDINESKSEFSVVGEKIRFGMGAIKNVGTNAVKAIESARLECKSFKSVADFFKNVDLRVANKKVVESLVKCGAFDSFDKNRGRIYGNIDLYSDAGQRTQRDREKGQYSLFPDHEETELITTKNDPSQDWADLELLHNEKEALGFYMTGHPLKKYEKDIRHFTNSDTQTIKEGADGKIINISGIVISIRQHKTKKGETMAFVSLEDLKGSVDVIVFPETYAKSSQLLESNDPIWIKGTLSSEEDSVKILAEDIQLLSKIRDYLTASVHININPTGIEDVLEALKSIVETNKGKSPVFLHLDFPDHSKYCIQVDPTLQVKPSDELIEVVENLTGISSVYLDWDKVANQKSNGNRKKWPDKNKVAVNN